MINKLQIKFISIIAAIYISTGAILSVNNATITIPWYSLFQSNNIPDSISFLPIYCSGFNIHYNSDKKIGLWALTPQVAHFYGLKINKEIDERYDIQKSTNVALQYLHDLHEIYNDWNITILAFLESPTALNRIAKKNNIDINNSSDKDIQFLYSKIMSRHDICKNKTYPESQSSLHSLLAEIDSIYYHRNFKQITIDSPIRLSILCDSLHLSKEIFYKYNGKILTTKEWLTSSDNIYIPQNVDLQKFDNLYKSEDEYLQNQLLIAKQQEEAKQEALKKAIEEANATIIYKVKSGDTLSHIAKKHHVTVKQLKQWNNIKSDIIQIGQKIKIKPQ